MMASSETASEVRPSFQVIVAWRGWRLLHRSPGRGVRGAPCRWCRSCWPGTAAASSSPSSAGRPPRQRLLRRTPRAPHFQIPEAAGLAAKRPLGCCPPHRRRRRSRWKARGGAPVDIRTRPLRRWQLGSTQAAVVVTGARRHEGGSSKRAGQLPAEQRWKRAGGAVAAAATPPRRTSPGHAAAAGNGGRGGRRMRPACPPASRSPQQLPPTGAVCAMPWGPPRRRPRTDPHSPSCLPWTRSAKRSTANVAVVSLLQRL